MKTISVGIPAYHSSENITLLLKSVLSQKLDKKFKLIEVVCYTDSDIATFDEARKTKNKLLNVVNAKKRGGFAEGFKYIIKNTKGDIIVVLNDDILIKDSSLLNKLAQAFTKNNIGMVTGNPRPLPGRNFVQKAGISTFNAYYRTRYLYKNGQNKMTCDGKILAFSRLFIGNVKFHANNKKFGNLDVWLYFKCVTSKFKYYHSKKAQVFFDFPSTVKDYYKWTSRNNANRTMLISEFGDIVKEEYALPKSIHIKSVVLEALKNPLGCLFIYWLGILAKKKSKKIAKDFNPIWDVVVSTKKKLR